MGLAGPLLVAALTAVSVLIFFGAFWRMARKADPVADRLREYGGLDAIGVTQTEAETGAARKRLPLVARLLTGFGMGEALAGKLSRAGLPMTAAEFAVINMVAAGLGLLLGAWRVGLLFGVLLALLFGYAPVMYLNSAIGKRKRAFTNQLPEVLDLLVGALRAGYGLNQALDTLVDQLGPPASDEFRRVTRGVGLGLPVQQALNGLAERIDTEDVGLVVTAINVQYEMGGNLAEILSTISDTVRDRIRMKQEIRTLTAQQRFSGYVLAFLPMGMALILTLISPDYIKPLFAPGWIRVLPAFAVFLQIIGFIVISKIVDIEV
jgi:tight adherence protein B